MKILQDKAPWAYIKEGQQFNSTTGSFCERDLRNTQVKVFWIEKCKQRKDLSCMPSGTCPYSSMIDKQIYSNTVSKISNFYLPSMKYVLGLPEAEGRSRPPRGIPRKRCSENMQQIYRWTPMPKCDLILKWHFGMGVLL